MEIELLLLLLLVREIFQISRRHAAWMHHKSHRWRMVSETAAVWHWCAAAERSRCYDVDSSRHSWFKTLLVFLLLKMSGSSCDNADLQFMSISWMMIFWKSEKKCCSYVHVRVHGTVYVYPPKPFTGGTENALRQSPIVRDLRNDVCRTTRGEFLAISVPGIIISTWRQPHKCDIICDNRRWSTWNIRKRSLGRLKTTLIFCFCEQLS